MWCGGNYPEFISFPGSIMMNESTPVGMVITCICGEDLDLGYDRRLLYNISGGGNYCVYNWMEQWKIEYDWIFVAGGKEYTNWT